MLPFAIVISVLILIMFLRFGVIVEYSDEGFNAWLKAGFLKFKLTGGEKKKKKEKPKKKKKDKEKKKRGIGEMIPGILSEFMSTLKAVLNMMKRLKRRLLIKQLTLYYVSANEDPSKTALQFGAANAVFGTITGGLDKHFRVKKLDLRTGFDFLSAQQKIYAKAILTLAVWEVLYVTFALFPVIISFLKILFKGDKKKITVKERKDGSGYGKKTDKRSDGNNDAKNEGTD